MSVSGWGLEHHYLLLFTKCLTHHIICLFRCVLLLIFNWSYLPNVLLIRLSTFSDVFPFWSHCEANQHIKTVTHKAFSASWCSWCSVQHLCIAPWRLSKWPFLLSMVWNSTLPSPYSAHREINKALTMMGAELEILKIVSPPQLADLSFCLWFSCTAWTDLSSF